MLLFFSLSRSLSVSTMRLKRTLLVVVCAIVATWNPCRSFVPVLVRVSWLLASLASQLTNAARWASSSPQLGRGLATPVRVIVERERQRQSVKRMAVTEKKQATQWRPCFPACLPPSNNPPANRTQSSQLPTCSTRRDAHSTPVPSPAARFTLRGLLALGHGGDNAALHLLLPSPTDAPSWCDTARRRWRR